MQSSFRTLIQSIFFSSRFATVPTGGLGAFSKVACPGQEAPSGMYSDNRVFSFQGARGADRFTPSLLSRVREGVENQKFIILLSS